MPIISGSQTGGFLTFSRMEQGKTYSVAVIGNEQSMQKEALAILGTRDYNSMLMLVDDKGNCYDAEGQSIFEGMHILVADGSIGTECPEGRFEVLNGRWDITRGSSSCINQWHPV